MRMVDRIILQVATHPKFSAVLGAIEAYFVAEINVTVVEHELRLFILVMQAIAVSIGAFIACYGAAKSLAKYYFKNKKK